MSTGYHHYYVYGIEVPKDFIDDWNKDGHCSGCSKCQDEFEDFSECARNFFDSIYNKGDIGIIYNDDSVIIGKSLAGGRYENLLPDGIITGKIIDEELKNYKMSSEDESETMDIIFNKLNIPGEFKYYFVNYYT